MCSQHVAVDHILSWCEVLAKTEYIFRRNKAAAYLHSSICKDHDIGITDKLYEHKPETAMHNWKTIILLHEKFLQFDGFRAVVFQLNLKFLDVKITNLLRVVA